MPLLNWGVFDTLPGSRDKNFEDLCRALIRLHFGRFGKFEALINQPGVEFHLRLSDDCPALGAPPRWYGWQCKCHELTRAGVLRSTSKKDIEDSLTKSLKYLPDLTDWVLWTPYTLSKADQEWFKSLQTKINLHMWNKEEIDTYLSGPGLILRSTYFGDLVITPEDLKQRHNEAIQPILERWLIPVHQSVDAERIIRRMLAEPESWVQMNAIGARLQKAIDLFSNSNKFISDQDATTNNPFIFACSAFADTLLQFHKFLAEGDLEIVQQKLAERKTLISSTVCTTPRRLRASNSPIAMDATNALNDMRTAVKLLDEIDDFLGVGLVAVLADAGSGKTQMAAQLTSPQKDRPAGILLYGRDLHRGQTLDDLARRFTLTGNPPTSMERLLASLDAAGKRARCRLPIVIDGLNDAENPKDWKDPLANLAETIKRYPNVLVICTLRTGEHRRIPHLVRPLFQSNARESFAVMALPGGIRKIESEGFGGNVREAIEKYFSYYKIEPGDAELPLDFFKHPLTLRIFCEVTNPKRISIVKVVNFTASLSPLFEKYIANACERISQMSNLSHSYNIEEAQTAIYRLGLELWKAKKREVSEEDYRAIMSDNAHSWDSSIVNLLAQEGIIFRNPGSEPGKYVITPVYDALGGYIVANSLLTFHGKEPTFAWLEGPDVISSFGGDDSHELAFDIFRSLVALVPSRFYGSHLWKVAPESLRDAALKLTTELEAKFIDRETVTALLELLQKHPKENIRLFSNLQITRGEIDNPLNSTFLDFVLRRMSNSERDLSWTEWIRNTQSERMNDLLALERKWKEDLTFKNSI